MKVFLDTNVVIDFYDQRREFYYPAAIIFDLAYRKKIDICVSVITFVNAFFILRKTYSKNELYTSMKSLAALCEITKADSLMIHRSLGKQTNDFEDCVQYESAMAHSADVIVTRNIKDFTCLDCNVMTPTEFLDTHSSLLAQ